VKSQDIKDVFGLDTKESISEKKGGPQVSPPLLPNPSPPLSFYPLPSPR